MSRMFLYLLEMTDEGGDRAPAFEVNHAMVVRAANSKHARALAADYVIDEPRDTWLNGRYSTCRRLGEVTDGAKRKAEVVCQDSNAT